MFVDSVNHFKSVFSYEIFIEPADQNYQLARWAKIHGFHREFYWQSLQAIEKYCKAALILNGENVKDGNHEIEGLFIRCSKRLGNLVVQRLERPASFPPELWSDEEPERFLRLLYQQGNPNSRYGATSWFNRPCDLVKLDCLVFSLRRCTIGLDWIVGADFDVDLEIRDFVGQTFAAVLHAKPAYQVRGEFRSVSSPATLSGENVADALRLWNFQLVSDSSCFARPLPPSMAAIIGPGRNSLLDVLCNVVSRQHSCMSSNLLLDGVAWMLDAIQLEKRAMKTLKAHVDRLTTQQAGSN